MWVWVCEMEDSKLKVLLALGTVGAAGVWWWLRGRTVPQHAPPPDPDSFTTPVAKVAKLYLYPSSLVTGLSWSPHSVLLEDSSTTGKFNG